MDPQHAQWHERYDGFAEAAGEVMELGRGDETIGDFEERAAEARRILFQVINASRVWFLNSRKEGGAE